MDSRTLETKFEAIVNDINSFKETFDKKFQDFMQSKNQVMADIKNEFVKLETER